MSYPKVGEDGSVKRAAKRDALAAAFSCDAQPPAQCAEAARWARQSGQAGRGTGKLFALFVFRLT